MNAKNDKPKKRTFLITIEPDRYPDLYVQAMKRGLDLAVVIEAELHVLSQQLGLDQHDTLTVRQVGPTLEVTVDAGVLDGEAGAR